MVVISRVGDDRIIFIKLGHGQEFDGRDPEFLEIRNLLDYPLICPGMAGLAVGRSGESANVEFVDDGVLEGCFQGAVALPVKVVMKQSAAGLLPDWAGGAPGSGTQGLAVGVNEDGGRGVGLQEAGVRGARYLVPVVEFRIDPVQADVPDVTGAVLFRMKRDVVAGCLS